MRSKTIKRCFTVQSCCQLNQSFKILFIQLNFMDKCVNKNRTKNEKKELNIQYLISHETHYLRLKTKTGTKKLKLFQFHIISTLININRLK